MKKRSHQVNSGNSARKSNSCGVITREDLLRMERAARREAEIAVGHNRASGSGAHGGSKRELRRRDRRQSRDIARSWGLE